MNKTARRGATLWLRFGIVSMMVSVGVSTAAAKTLHWRKSVASGAFSDAANWTTDAANTTDASVGPEPGDSLYFTMTRETTITGGEFDVGSEGLRFVIANQSLISKVPFVGSGKIKVEGWSGSLVMSVSSAYYGGTSISQKACVHANVKNALGPGLVSISNEGDSNSAAQLRVSAGPFTNDISVEGNDYIAPANGLTPCTFYLENGIEFSGDISSSVDLVLFEAWGNHTFSGTVDAQGKKIVVRQNSTSVCKFTGLVHASLSHLERKDKEGPFGTIELTGDCSSATDCCLTFGASHSVNPLGGKLAETAVWGGDVAIEGAGTLLKVDADSCLNGATSDIVLTHGGKLELNNSGLLAVKSLTIDGAIQAPGIYTSDKLPAAITGDGALLVGSAMQKVVWVGGDRGAWTNVENWNPKLVPGSGCEAVFPSATTLTEEDIEIDGGNLMLTCNGEVSVYARFIGCGTLVKNGSSTLHLYAANTHTGGMTLLPGSGVVNSHKNGALGGGKIEIFRKSGKRATLRFDDVSQEVSCDIEYYGAYTQYELLAYDIYGNNPVVFSGNILAHDDLSVFSVYYANPSLEKCLRFDGAVVVHGRTVHLLSNKSSANAPFGFNGVVDASVVKAHQPKTTGDVGDSDVYLGPSANFSDPDATISISNGYLRIAVGAVISCTNIILSAKADGDAAGTGISLSDGSALTSNSVVRVYDRAKIAVDGGVKAEVGELYSNDMRIPNGTYNAARLPDVISGEGSIRVGPKGGLVLVVR